MGGDENYRLFSQLTYFGYFINELSRLGMDGNRSYFKSFLKDCGVIKRTGEMKFNDAKYILMKECETEYSLKKIDKQLEEEKSEPWESFINQKTSENTRFRWLHRATILFGFIMAVSIAYIVWRLFNICELSVGPDSFAIIFSSLVAVFSYFLATASSSRQKCRDGNNRRVQYCSEFNDLVRHLEANLKVMVQVRKELGTRRPSSIHFDNLAWPDSSILLAEDMSRIVSAEDLDQLARIKVNIRNINNSSGYLVKYSESDVYSKDKMVSILDWEITRYFGYLINFIYFKSRGKFKFPEPDQMDMFIEEDSLRNHMSSLFMDYSADERTALVDKYIERYQSDRREKRAVLFE